MKYHQNHIVKALINKEDIQLYFDHHDLDEVYGTFNLFGIAAFHKNKEVRIKKIIISTIIGRLLRFKNTQLVLN